MFDGILPYPLGGRGLVTVVLDLVYFIKVGLRGREGRGCDRERGGGGVWEGEKEYITCTTS